MNNKQIKIIVFILSAIFVVILSRGMIMNKYDESLMGFQVEVEQSLSLKKDTTLNLNNSYHSLYINYDKLTDSNKILLEDIDALVKKYPEQLKIKKIRDMIYKQDNNIDLIKRSNSIVSNSLYFIKQLPPKMFLHSIYKDELGAKSLRKVSRNLVDISYDIKLADKSIFHKYEDNINKLENTKVINKKLKYYKRLFVIHTKKILNEAKFLSTNIKEYDSYENKLNQFYLDTREEILFNHLNAKKKMRFAQVILLLLLISFIFLIIRFLKLEKLHKAEEKKLKELINKYIIISTTDLDGKITSASEAFSKRCGYSKDELIGQSHNIVRHPDMPKSAFKAMWGTIKAGKTWRGEVKNLKKDGGYYWVDANIEPIFGKDGNIESYVAIRLDITDKIKLNELVAIQDDTISEAIKDMREQKETAEKALKAKGEFLAIMSHEIRTPLNGILGFVDILKDSLIKQENQEHLQTISSSSHHLLGIINDILDFTKIESGKLEVEYIDFDIKQEINSMINLFKTKAGKKNISLTLKMDNNLPQTINSDSLRIKQIISNLLSNSIKFTNQSKNITLKVDYNNNLLNVSIKDEGIGIDKDKCEHIFEPFSQEDTSTTRKYGGTGLGLSISSELVKLLEGELKVKSEVGIGSEFYFSIPIKVVKNSVKNSSIENSKINLSGKILLVEDDKTNQMFMKIILKKMGLTFDIASDGVEAVEIFKKNALTEETLGCKYDAILMDENMPNMNGIESTKHIIEYEKKNNLIHTPIIALTANALKGDRERFLNAGMDEYLSKPIDKKKLGIILNNFLVKQKR